MVFGKILGLLDIAALVCITAVFFHFSPAKAVIWVIFYLLIKGIMFKYDFNSWFDIGIALYTLLLALGVRIGVVYAFILLYMGQKGLMSLV